jgi:ADP-ribosylation factor GTPase-activating protein 2/3
LQTSSATANRAAKLGGSRLTSSAAKPAQAAGPKKTKLGGLGAKIAPATIDFEEAERKAAAEAERIKQLGYDRQREEEEERARKEAEALEAASRLSIKDTNISTKSTPSTSKAPARSANQPGFARLGFGALPGAGAAAAAAAPVAKSTPTVDESPTTARDKFGNQKAISSDMYFGRNAYDPNAVSEAQNRLQSFQGATAISSNQYFGRDEEEEQDRAAEGGLLGDGSLAGLESAARDAYSKFLANPDVQNAADNIRAGALKLSDYLASMSER